MKKGEQTKQNILGIALNQASVLGLGSISIGMLAKQSGMSKSGLFAHFNSKENLQLEILDYASQIFKEDVYDTAMEQTVGLDRIRMFVRNWVKWSDQRMAGGCIFVAAAVEFDDQPGAVHDRLAEAQHRWISAVTQVAGEALQEMNFGNKEKCHEEGEQLTYEVYSLILGFYHFDRTLSDTGARTRLDKGFERLMARYHSKSKKGRKR